MRAAVLLALLLGGAAEAPGLLNPGFEEGRGAGWEEANSRGLSLVRTGEGLRVQPAAGEWMACLFAVEAHETSRLGQMITVPEAPVRMRLQFRILSEELCDVPYYDGLTVRVGDATVVDWSVCRSSESEGWQDGHFDLSPFAGQTVPLVFEASAGRDGGSTTVCLDELAFDRSGE